MAQNLKERAVGFVINRLISLANKKVPIADLQKKHNAFEARIMRMRLTDINRTFYFRIKDGKLEYLAGEQKPYGGFDLTSDTLINIAIGKRTMMNPATGATYEVPYTPMDAALHNEIRVWGDKSTNDVLLFARAVYKELYEDLKSDIGAIVRAGTNGA